MYLRSMLTYIVSELIVAIEIPGGSRNLNMNINDQQAILNAYIVVKAD